MDDEEIVRSTEEEWEAFRGYRWLQKRVWRWGLVEWKNIFNPEELKRAQIITWEARELGIVSRTVYRDTDLSSNSTVLDDDLIYAHVEVAAGQSAQLRLFE